MTAEDFIKEFGLLAEAPNGVQKLREMILQLAVRGSLVPQDPTDEPASVLLERIGREKDRMVEAGEIRGGKSSSPNHNQEGPYQLPNSWEWVCLDEVCSYIQRGRGPKYDDNSNIPVVSQKCVQWSGFDVSVARFIDSASLERYGPERFLRAGDLLWNSTGTGTIGRINVFPYDEIPYETIVADSHVTVVRPLFVDSNYLWIYLASPVVQRDFEARMSGTTNQIELNTATARSEFVALPPLVEQKRIVAKVDELMGLCDELEERQNRKNEARITLNASCLNALLDIKGPRPKNGNAKRIFDNFDILYDNPGNVAELRKAILQLAVQGRLVPQDPSDEPAKELLTRISEEKNILIAEGKVKKSKPIKRAKLGNTPFKVPPVWSWCQLDDVSLKVHYGFTASADPGATSVKLLRITDIQDGFVNWNTVPGCQININKFQNYALSEGDILIARTGGTIGKSYIVKDISVSAVFASYLIRVVPSSQICPSYVKLFLGSELYWCQLYEGSKGTGQPNVNSTALRQLSLPLPPLGEQKRIVDKVDELMRFCDELEETIGEASQKGEELLITMIYYVLKSGKRR